MRLSSVFFPLTVSVLLAGITGTSVASESVKSVGQFETRCGWFVNPTPANIWLLDRDAEWIIGLQGGYQAVGDWAWPDFESNQWVANNGNYGYGCACLEVRVDHQSSRVIEIESSHAQSLAVCRQDPALERWAFE